MGGTVPQGNGCPGTTHGPPLEEGEEASNNSSDDGEGFGGPGGFGAF